MPLVERWRSPEDNLCYKDGDDDDYIGDDDDNMYHKGMGLLPTVGRRGSRTDSQGEGRSSLMMIKLIKMMMMMMMMIMMRMMRMMMVMMMMMIMVMMMMRRRILTNGNAIKKQHL